MGVGAPCKCGHSQSGHVQSRFACRRCVCTRFFQHFTYQKRKSWENYLNRRISIVYPNNTIASGIFIGLTPRKLILRQKKERVWTLRKLEWQTRTLRVSTRRIAIVIIGNVQIPFHRFCARDTPTEKTKAEKAILSGGISEGVSLYSELRANVRGFRDCNPKTPELYNSIKERLRNKEDPRKVFSELSEKIRLLNFANTCGGQTGIEHSLLNALETS